MANWDVRTARRDLYTARRGRFDVVDVPQLPVLAADGHGDPNTSADYRAVLEALYSTGYAVRALAKAEFGRTNTVGPLEGLWSAADLGAFAARDKQSWEWTMLLVQPEWITPDLVEQAVDRVGRTKHLAAAGRVRFEHLHEGLSVQTLHVGPYDDEGPTIARMHQEVMPAERLRPSGRHHEIYLSDARRTDPSRLRTILRQPVVRIA